MKLISAIVAIILLLAKRSGFSQGFVNLNFDSAQISACGGEPGLIPITNALPGWSACLFNSSSTNALTQIPYDAITLGAALITLVDTNNPESYHLDPIQGKYGVDLFGGGSGVFFAAQISQTGLVPAGTESLLFDAQTFGYPFTVTLGGKALNLIPLQTFSNYTLYGGGISFSAGQVETLCFTEPPAIGAQPSALELDDIQFSTTPVVPEPTEFALAALGGLLFGWNRWRKSSR